MTICLTKYFLWNLMNLFRISECLRLELREKYPFSVNMGYFSPYIFSTWNLGQVYFWISIFQWLETANAFDESSVYYPKLRGHHMWLCNCYTPLVKIYIYCTFSTLYIFIINLLYLFNSLYIYIYTSLYIYLSWFIYSSFYIYLFYIYFTL